MFTNKLKLNPDKIEFMLIGNRHHPNKFDSKFPVDILNNAIPPAAHTKILGVIIDSDFQHHIRNTVKVCNYFIPDVIFPVLPNHLTLDASTALVSSRLDYCNSLLHSLPGYKTRKTISLINSKCFSQSCHQVYYIHQL